MTVEEKAEIVGRALEGGAFGLKMSDAERDLATIEQLLGAPVGKAFWNALYLKSRDLWVLLSYAEDVWADRRAAKLVRDAARRRRARASR